MILSGSRSRGKSRISAEIRMHEVNAKLECPSSCDPDSFCMEEDGVKVCLTCPNKMPLFDDPEFHGMTIEDACDDVLCCIEACGSTGTSLRYFLKITLAHGNKAYLQLNKVELENFKNLFAAQLGQA